MKKIFLRLPVFFLLLTLPFSAGAEQIRLGVADFVSRADMKGFENLRQITDVFREVLSASTETIEVTSTRSLQAFGGMTAENAANAGRSDGCQYVLLGAISANDMGYSQTYGGFFGVVPKTATQTQTITLDTKMIDVKTGKIVLSASGTGAASFSYDVNKEVANALKKEHQKEVMDRYNTMMKASAAAASSMVAEKVCVFLAGEYPEISSIKANKGSSAKKSDKKNARSVLGSVRINRGTSAGVRAGTLYRIYIEGEEVFDLNGGSLGHEKFNIAIVEVKDARTNFSTAEVVGGIFKNLRNGDKAEQISQDEAERIIDKEDFTRNRLSEFLR